MKNLNFISSIILAAIFFLAIFSTSEVSAQSTGKNKKSNNTNQSLNRINAEILALEKELANLELVAKQNNVDLGKPYNYTILDKIETVAITEEKATAKK